jgi:hypothetical protein
MAAVPSPAVDCSCGVSLWPIPTALSGSARPTHPRIIPPPSGTERARSRHCVESHRAAIRRFWLDPDALALALTHLCAVSGRVPVGCVALTCQRHLDLDRGAGYQHALRPPCDYADHRLYESRTPKPTRKPSHSGGFHPSRCAVMPPVSSTSGRALGVWLPVTTLICGTMQVYRPCPLDSAIMCRSR